MNTTPWYEQGYRNTHRTRIASVEQTHGHGLEIRLERTRQPWDRKRGLYSDPITESLGLSLTADDVKELLDKIALALQREEAIRQPCLTCKGPNVDWPLFLVCLDCRTTPQEATP